MNTEAQADAAAAIGAKPGWPSPIRAWTTVLVLMTAYAVAFVDRQILSLLVEPVKRDLDISDTQFSLLSGMAFTLFYTVMGIPFAWLADRKSRQRLIALSIGIWSLMTAAGGLANSFITLFLARVGVGVGEAGLSPAAYSMIADSFPEDKRARPLSVYVVGSVMGVGMALIIGGAVIEWAISAPPSYLPFFGELRSWQLAFLIVAIPGPSLMLLMMAVREPQRHERPVAAARADEPSLKAFLRRRWFPFAFLSLGYSLISISVAAYLTWTPAMMVRSYGWSLGQIGAVYGAILIIFNTTGILAGGWLADRMASKGMVDAAPRVSIFSAIVALPFAVGAPFAPSGAVCMAVIAAMSFTTGLSQGLPAPCVQAIAPNRLRARAMAIYLLIANILAFTFGPTGVALISDYWLQDSARIGQAIAIVSAIVMPLGAIALAMARKSFAQAVIEEA